MKNQLAPGIWSISSLPDPIDRVPTPEEVVAYRKKMNKRCIVCEKKLEFDGHCYYDTLIWEATGNFGSTIFDPPTHGSKTSVHLEVLICDDCIIKKRDFVETVTVTRDIKQERKPFEGNDKSLD